MPIRLVITFETEGALAPAPRAKAILPLALDPGDRRVLRTGVRTIAFGDPSYDRQLGSTTESDIKQYGDVRGLLAVDRQEPMPGSVLWTYRRLLAFRRKHPALRTGTIAFLDAPERVLAFVRENAHERLLCLFNLSADDAAFPLPAGSAVRALEGHGFAGAPDHHGGGTVRLPPGEAFFGAMG